MEERRSTEEIYSMEKESSGDNGKNSMVQEQTMEGKQPAEKDSSKKYEIDMCNGPLLGKIMIFYIPLMLSGILQLLFNAADIVVVGRFAGNQALAAVGSTGSLTNLLVNIFIGLSVGANVLVARFFGAGQDRELKLSLALAKP